jgi:probable HAF family extracellular repeat protein
MSYFEGFHTLNRGALSSSRLPEERVRDSVGPVGEHTMTGLGTLPGGSSSLADGINAVGQVVGYSDSAGGQHAFLWQNGAMTDLGTLPGDSSASGSSWPMAISRRAALRSS